MKLKFLGIVLIMLLSAEAMAQIKIYPIKSNNPSKNTTNTQGRTASETLTLPIWDDFSTAGNQPDTAIWQSSENVFIGSGRGFQPPSINVASFDGLKADGTPYTSNPTSEGETDALTTCPIDLSSATAADDIYLSFFYQFAGLGEVPDPSDSLRVEFMNADSAWVSVWPSVGAPLDRSGAFEQILIAVDDPVFFHDAFRFRFQAFGRQSGPFDIWNVDYIYINEGRSANDDSYPDRTIVSPLISIFGKYTAIPRAHFSPPLNQSSITVTNLDNDAPQPFTIDLITRVISYKDSSIVSNNSFSVSNQSAGPAIAAGAIDTVFVPNIVPDAEFATPADSTLINYKFHLATDDSIDTDYVPAVYGDVDFTVNDFTSKDFDLKDYYAYDDGTAEVGAGLNFSGNKLAYQYNKLSDTLNYIKAFDIHFPFVSNSSNGKSMELIIWSDIKVDSTAESVLHRETITISSVSGLNRFTRIELQQAVLVEDSVFYIGYRQNTAGELAIGLDKNNDTSDRVFYNLTGTWRANETVKGSFMIRPVFTAEPSEVVGLPDFSEENTRIYPNPTDGRLFINEPINHLEIIGIDGRTHNVSWTKDNEQTQVDLTPLPSGIYLIKFIKKGKLVSKKIIKQ